MPSIKANIRSYTFNFPMLSPDVGVDRTCVAAALVIGFGYGKSFDTLLLHPDWRSHTTLLLLQRQKAPHVLQPPGGKCDIECDRNVGDIIRRECQEELGFKVHPVAYLGTSTITGVNTQYNGADLHHVLSISDHNLKPALEFPRTVLRHEESSLRRWIPISEIAMLPREVIIPSLKDSVDRIIDVLSPHSNRAHLHAQLVALRRRS